MAVRQIEYTVYADRLEPSVRQLGGMQGDHKATEVLFEISGSLYEILKEQTESTNGRLIYRFDGYDGAGGVHSSDTKDLPAEDGEELLVKLKYPLEEWITRYGGQIKVVLVISLLKDDSTEMELYNYPAVCQLKNRPFGTPAPGENHESISTLAQVTKESAEIAARAKDEAIAAQIKVEETAEEVNSRIKPLEADIEKLKQSSVTKDYVDNAIGALEDDVAYLSTHAATKQYVDDAVALSSGVSQEYVDGRLEGVYELVTDNQDDIRNLGERAAAVETSVETLKRTYVDTQRFEETSQGFEERITYAESDIINLQEDIVIIKEDYVTKKYVDDAVASSGGVSKDYVDSHLEGISDLVSDNQDDISNLGERTETLENDVEIIKQSYVALEYVNDKTKNIPAIENDVETIKQSYVSLEYVNDKTKNIPTIENNIVNIQGDIDTLKDDLEFIEVNYASKKYVDDAVASSGGTGGGSSEDVIDKIIDPDNNPLSVAEDSVLDIPMEVGGLSTSSGELVERDDAIRSNDFIFVTPNETIQFASSLPVGGDEKIRVCCYGEDKTFIETIYPRLQADFHIETDWHYIKFYRSDTGDEQVTMSVVRKGKVEKAEFKKIYFAEHGYELYGDIIDDETMHKLVVYASGKDENTFNIIEVKAPSHNPEEATICLMNWGNDTKQFVDFSSMVYNPENPTAEIVCQTRGGKKLPEFSIRYNDGQGAGRVKKFTVHPDAIPIELTAQGLKVRKNNTFDNNETEEDYVVVNLAEAAESINDIAENYATKKYVDDAVASSGGGTGGGVSSWNHLTDKPFYEERKIGTYDYSNPPSATINFNGMVLGKITDDILTPSHFNGAKATLSFTPDGSTISNLSQGLNSDMLTKISLDCGTLYQLVDGYLTCMVASATKTGVFEFNGIRFTIPQVGTYIGFVFTNGFAQLSMSIEYDWIQPLKAKYLDIVNYQIGKSLIEEQDLVFENTNGLYTLQLEAINLVAGTKYNVLWDGIDYVYEATEKDGKVVIGDAFGAYPFFVGVIDNQTLIGTVNTSATHTVAINEVGECEIKGEYLPKSLYTEIDQRIENYINEALGGDY